MFVCVHARMWKLEVDARCLHSPSVFDLLMRQCNSLDLALTEWLDWLSSKLADLLVSTFRVLIEGLGSGLL